MPKVYDDWDRLVRATLRREELWQLCHDHSRTPSGGSTTSGTASPGSSSPVLEMPPKSSRTRASPLNRARFDSKRRVSPLNQQGGANHMREVVLKSSSSPVLPLSQENGQELKKEKAMRRSKSRMRLDRWVWTRWLSNTFS